MASRNKAGIFVIADIPGPVGDRIAALQKKYDPLVTRLGRPHVTITGSSGMGPIAPDTPVEELRRRLGPIAQSTAPITLSFGAPTRFMQTQIVVLPLDPHGPLRTLHERIKVAGLRAAPPRFFFTPHVTINLYRELPREALKELMTERFHEPVTIDTIECRLTRDTGETRHLVTLPLSLQE